MELWMVVVAVLLLMALFVGGLDSPGAEGG